MANIPPIQFKRSQVKGRVPSVESLLPGELAINTADGLLYTKDSENGVVVRMGGTGAGIITVDSEGVLSNFDSDDTKHKEAIVYLINRQKLVGWDSETDSWADIGGSGTGGSGGAGVVTEILYEDFTISNLRNPTFTITDVDLINITDPNNFYVLWEDYPLPKSAFTVLGSKGSWAIKLHGDVDKNGSTFSVGERIRIGKGTDLNVVTTELDNITQYSLDPVNAELISSTTNLTNVVYDSDSYSLLGNGAWSSNTTQITGVIFGSEMNAADENVYWFTSATTPFKITTENNFTEAGFRYFVNEDTTLKIKDSDSGNRVGKIYSYYKTPVSNQFPIVEANTAINADSFVKAEALINYFSKSSLILDKEFSREQNENPSEGSSIRFLDNEWKRDTDIIKVRVAGSYSEEGSSDDSDSVSLASLPGMHNIFLQSTRSEKTSSDYKIYNVSGKNYIARTIGLKENTSLTFNYFEVPDKDFTSLINSISGTFNSGVQYPIAYRLCLYETELDFFNGNFFEYEIYGTLPKYLTDIESTIRIKRLR